MQTQYKRRWQTQFWKRTKLHRAKPWIDSTGQKQTEVDLRISEAHQRALLSAIPDLVFRNHRDGTFLDYHAGNPQELFMPPEHFIGRTYTELFPAEFARNRMQHVEEVLKTGQEEIYHYSLPIQGKMMDYEARMVVCGEDEVMTIVRNITVQKQMQRQEFELALEKERHQLLTAFIRNAAHEFRTPLTTIELSAYLLYRSNDSGQRLEKHKQIETEIIRITRLIDTLLLMVKLDIDAPAPTTSVDINEQLKLICRDAAEKYGEQFTITCDLQPNLPCVSGQEDYLDTAFREIIENACRFSLHNGIIRVISTFHTDHVRIEISDNGLGIDGEHLPHIFETFWRLDEAHSTPGFGAINRAQNRRDARRRN